MRGRTWVGKSTPEGGSYIERIAREKEKAQLFGPPDVDYSDVNEMLGWLKRETFAVSKEAELRIRDATSIVTDYASGQISQKEANDRRFLYSERWGQPLGGMYNPDRMTDDEILEERDRIAEWIRSRQPASKPPSRLLACSLHILLG